MVCCSKCDQPLDKCSCPDLPKEDAGALYWHYLNRVAEEWARWLRALGFLLVLVWAHPTHATDSGQWANSPYQSWYKKQVPTPETQRIYDLLWGSCCDHGDVCQECVVHRVSNTPPWKDGWYYIRNGIRKELPPHIVEYVPWTPTGKPVLFLAPWAAGKIQTGDPVCLKVPGGSS